MADTDRARRPFWVHQLAEYVIGIMLVAAGLQTPDPAAPSLLGALIVANAAIVSGPLSAFEVVPRRIHRLIDPVIFTLVLLTAVVPVFDIDPGTRFVIGAVGVVLAFVWWYSSYDPPVRSASPGERLDAGQFAGRLAGRGVNAWRNRPRR
ncbi:MAG: hypothetical protein M3337_03980 [Actinomycetota bacterium]|nr:hypothetical protein [Actinomycetota bacterium]